MSNKQDLIDTLPSRARYFGISVHGYSTVEQRRVAQGVTRPYQKAEYAAPNYRAQLSVRKQVLYLGSHKDPRVLAVLSDFARRELAPWITEVARAEVNYPEFSNYEDLPEKFRERVLAFRKALSEDRWAELQEFNAREAEGAVAREFEERTGEDSQEAFVRRIADAQEQINSGLGILVGVATQAVGRYAAQTRELLEMIQKNKVLEESERALRAEIAELRITAGIVERNSQRKPYTLRPVVRPAPVGLPLVAEQPPEIPAPSEVARVANTP